MAIAGDLKRSKSQLTSNERFLLRRNVAAIVVFPATDPPGPQGLLRLTLAGFRSA